MREIKFRAWDKITKKYFYSGTLDNGDVLVIHLDGEIEISSDDTYKPDDFIIEEFIGIRDAEDRDIYEGDIVQCSDAAFYRIVTYLTIRASFFFVHRDSWYPAAVATTSHAETVVVGNIHENPELLS